MLVVQLREEAVTSSLVHGVPGLGPPDQRAVVKGWKVLRLGAPEVARAAGLWKGGAVGAVVEFLKNTRVGFRASVKMARARVDEGRGEEDAWGSDGEEGGPGRS